MPESFINVYVRISTGFETMMYTAFGAYFVICGIIDFVIFTFVCASSSLVCPGFLAIPEVRITMSEPVASR